MKTNVVPITRAPELGDGKRPAHDVYAEAATLTAMMLKPEVAAEALSVASPDDYFGGGHRAIAESIAWLVEQGEPWDMSSVGIRLNETGKIAMLGGDPMFLVRMAEQVPAIVNPKKYAERIRDCARIRRLTTELTRHLAECYEPLEDVAAFMARVDGSIGEITRASGKARAMSAMTGVKAAVARLGQPLGDRVETGLRPLDEMTTGLEPGCFYVLGGRPGMGKTAMALQLAVSASKRKRRVLYASLEMSHAELWDRVLSSESGVPLEAIRKRLVGPTQWQHLTLAASLVAPLPFVTADAPGQTLLDIRATARQEHAELVVVDHVGLMKAVAGSAGAKRSREQEVAEFSRGLKAIAKELRIPVIALAQVNRQVAKSGQRPSLADLRESGSLEQDTDGVWFVHRPGYYDPKAGEEKLREAELVIAKQRQGPTGIIPLTWRAEHTRFEVRAFE